jgi:restriction endonuclease S subunit
MIGHFLNPFQNLEKQRKIAKFLETFIGNIFSLKNKRNYYILFA